jgi:hypothetical protein
MFLWMAKLIGLVLIFFGFHKGNGMDSVDQAAVLLGGLLITGAVSKPRAGRDILDPLFKLLYRRKIT